MTGTLQEFQRLIDVHAAVWKEDCEAWNVYGDILECDEIRSRPPLRVQIGSTMVGRDADGQDVKEPRYATTEEGIREEFRKYAEFGVGLFVRRGDEAGIAKRKENFDAKAAEKVAELESVRAERKKIEDACGYTAAGERKDETGRAVRMVDAQILAFVPADIEAARLMATWVANAYENEIGYLSEDDQLLAALKAIGGLQS